MKKLLRTLVVLSTVPLAGCGTVILKAAFAGWPAASPAGPPPGPPSNDQIVVQDQGNPVVSGPELIYHPPQKNAYFFSHPVANANATKTIFWIGRLKSGNGPFSFLVSADNTPGSIFLTNPLELRFSNNEVKVIDLNDTVLHSHPLNANSEHQVFISLRLQSGTYRITVQQPDAAEFEFDGQLNPLTANWIKSKARIVLETGFLPNATGTDEYAISQVIMREDQ